jgi:hypothetical protein
MKPTAGAADEGSGLFRRENVAPGCAGVAKDAVAMRNERNADRAAGPPCLWADNITQATWLTPRLCRAGLVFPVVFNQQLWISGHALGILLIRFSANPSLSRTKA